MAALDSLLAGRTLASRYRIGEVIGRGPFACVFRATDEPLQRRVALKVISGFSAATAGTLLRERLHREARAAAGPQHPNVPAVYDFGIDEQFGVAFVAMELLRGESLAARLTGGVGPDYALHILRGVGEGLAAGHRAGLVHGNVKPENIFLVDAEAGQKPRVVVLDFGVVRPSWLAPMYAAPELAGGDHERSSASDVFSLGVVGFQLLAGEKPFGAERSESWDATAALRARNPDIVPEVAAVIARALALPAAQRFPTAGAFVKALDQALSQPRAMQVSQPVPVGAAPDLAAPLPPDAEPGPHPAAAVTGESALTPETEEPAPSAPAESRDQSEHSEELPVPDIAPVLTADTPGNGDLAEPPLAVEFVAANAAPAETVAEPLDAPEVQQDTAPLPPTQALAEPEAAIGAHEAPEPSEPSQVPEIFDAEQFGAGASILAGPTPRAEDPTPPAVSVDEISTDAKPSPVSGESLATRFSRVGRVPSAEALRILRAATERLAAGHVRGLAHGDVGPETIWLADEDSSKLVITAPRVSRDDPQPLSPVYAAPEQLRGAQGTQASDIFGMGAAGFQLLTGEQPFGAGGAAKSFAWNAKAELQSRVPELSPELVAVIVRAVEYVPAVRFPDASAMLAALDAAMAASPRPEPAAPEPAPGAPKHERKVLRTVMALLALAAVAAAAFWMYRS